MNSTPRILTPRLGFKPFSYPWAYSYYKKQQRIHWLPEEVPLAEDVKDWAVKLNDAERSLLTHIFRFFTQSDIEVQDNYMSRLGGLPWQTEIKMMLSSFANMENIHIDAYSLLIETIGMPETTYSQFMEYDALKAKHETYSKFSTDSVEDVAKTLAMFGGFAEGVQLFASFAVLMNFPRFNKMKGMGQIVSWSVRDESFIATVLLIFSRLSAKKQAALAESLSQKSMELQKPLSIKRIYLLTLPLRRERLKGLLLKISSIIFAIFVTIGCEAWALRLYFASDGNTHYPG
jgi:ribonucleoside-diphosphate reductase beta chain